MQGESAIPETGSATRSLLYPLIIAGAVLSACLLGILTRPFGSLAAFWPANAVLLAIMVRNPKFAAPGGWAAAFAAYIAADLITGGQLHVTLWLTAANMAGAAAGFLVFRFFANDHRWLKSPTSVLYMIVACIMAAAVSALTGGGAARVLFDRDFLTGFEFWFNTELVNSLLIVPVILAFPTQLPSAADLRGSIAWQREELFRFVPVATLILSGLAGVVIGGPGAMSFPVPALLWCALAYGRFTTALLTMLFCSWLLIATSTGIIHLDFGGDPLLATASLRLGIALMALGPLTVSVVNASRNELLERMSYAADHDALTGVLSRRALLDRGGALLSECVAAGKPFAVLMLDMDNFKRINDRFGHAIGDRVLVRFAELAGPILGKENLFGRLGGEEFGVILPGVNLADAAKLAERVRAATETDAQAADIGVASTVSVGVTDLDQSPCADLDRLLALADMSLYIAKSAGRNRVVSETIFPSTRRRASPGSHSRRRARG